MVAASLNSMTQLEQEAMAGLLQLQTERVQHTPKPDPPQAQPQKENRADDEQTVTAAWVLTRCFSPNRIYSSYDADKNRVIENSADRTLRVISSSTQTWTSAPQTQKTSISTQTDNKKYLAPIKHKKTCFKYKPIKKHKVHSTCNLPLCLHDKISGKVHCDQKNSHKVHTHDINSQTNISLESSISAISDKPSDDSNDDDIEDPESTSKLEELVRNAIMRKKNLSAQMMASLAPAGRFAPAVPTKSAARRPTDVPEPSSSPDASGVRVSSGVRGSSSECGLSVIAGPPGMREVSEMRGPRGIYGSSRAHSSGERCQSEVTHQYEKRSATEGRGPSGVRGSSIVTGLSVTAGPSGMRRTPGVSGTSGARRSTEERSPIKSKFTPAIERRGSAGGRTQSKVTGPSIMGGPSGLRNSTGDRRLSEVATLSERRGLSRVRRSAEMYSPSKETGSYGSRSKSESHRSTGIRSPSKMQGSSAVRGLFGASSPSTEIANNTLFRKKKSEPIDHDKSENESERSDPEIYADYADSDEDWQPTEIFSKKPKLFRRRDTSSSSNKENMDDTEISDLDESKEKYPKTKTDHDLVPIGDGNAKVPGRLLKHMNWASYTNVTRKLLTAVFPRSVLATHSLTGKPSPAFPNKPAKKKLDAALVNDIVQTVVEKCGVPENVVRTSITTKCADESKMFRTRQRNKKTP